MSILIDKAKFTQLKMGSKQSLEEDEDRGMEQKTWEVYSFGKINVFRSDFNESREGFCQRGRGRSLYVDGPKTKKVQGPKVESGVRKLDVESI